MEPFSRRNVAARALGSCDVMPSMAPPSFNGNGSGAFFSHSLFSLAARLPGRRKLNEFILGRGAVTDHCRAKARTGKDWRLPRRGASTGAGTGRCCASGPGASCCLARLSHRCSDPARLHGPCPRETSNNFESVA